jgi:hypothetical protein
MFEQYLRLALLSPWRGWIVIFGSLAVGLGVTWPIAENYFGLCSQARELEGELAESRLAESSIKLLEKQLEERQAALKQLQAACVPPERMSAFRTQVFDIARETGCQVRRMNVGETRHRPWRRGDDPLKTEGAAKPEPTDEPGKYQLRWQETSMAVSGRLTHVRAFLAKLLDMNLLIHAHRFSLQAAEGNETEALLEIECLLYDLQEERAAS